MLDLAPRCQSVATARVSLHRAALLVVLLVGFVAVGWGASYSADEGAAIIQAGSLAERDGWIIEHPAADLDPEGRWYPLELSTQGPDGRAAFAKHPAYPLVLAGADRIGGHGAQVALSVGGTWLAAVGSGVLARHIAGRERTVLWLAGAGSPLLFNSYWVIAHSLAAAAVVWAVAAIFDPFMRDRWPVVPVPALLLGVATLLRTEAVIAALAVASVTVVLGIRSRRWLLGAAGLAAALSAWTARVINSRWSDVVVGGQASGTAPFIGRERSGGLGPRVDGLVNTWLRPTLPGDVSWEAVTVIVAAVLLLVAGWAVGRRDGPLASRLILLAAGLQAARLLVGEAHPVPGLAMAFPLLLLSVAPALMDRASWGRPTLALFGMVALLWVGVLATQYPEGGSAEWGGRYFAVGIPLAVPVLVSVLGDALGWLDRRSRTVIMGGTAVVLAALSLSSLKELRVVHDDTEHLLASIHEATDLAGGRPVILTDAPQLPRLDWARFDSHEWLLVSDADGIEVVSRLKEAGVSRWVVASADVDGFMGGLAGTIVEERLTRSVVVVALR